MEKSHKIYNLIFDFLLAAVVCFYNDLALYAVLVPWRAAVPQCRFCELPLRPNGQGGLLGFFAAEHSALPAGV